jgi:uncharacterized membrane protein YdjX (TVP38/TMEM64 family)
MKKSGLFFILVLVALALAGVVAFLTRRQELMGLVEQALAQLRSAGPASFFLAMALLPLIGAPLTFFTLTAGSVFGPQLGMPLVMFLSLFAIAANMALGHLLANHALRPPLKYLVRRMGYRLPDVGPGHFTDLIVLLRVTPGVPFPVQNYLLGLAAVPFVPYLLVSSLIALPLNASIIIFGEALLQGRGRIALIGLLLLLAVMAAIHLVRRRYGARMGPAN